MPPHDLIPLAGLALAELLWLRAVSRLRGRGQRIGRGQVVLWHLGMLLALAALAPPVDHLGEELLSAHMAQHLLLADIAVPLLLVGARNPVLAFLLPRPVLVPLARAGRLRRGLSGLRRPLVALPVFAATLYAWHLAPLFEAALASAWAHGLQHASFAGASVLVWWAALEPGRRRLRGELWKAGHVLGARLAGMMLGMALLAMRTPAYGGFYGDSATHHGLTPLGDQQIGGALMMAVDLGIMLFAFGFFFLRAGQEQDRADRAAAEEPVARRPAPVA